MRDQVRGILQFSALAKVLKQFFGVQFLRLGGSNPDLFTPYGLCGHGLTFGSLNSYAFPVCSVVANPAVDSAAVVPNLEAFPLNGLNQMQVLEAVHLAQNDIADVQVLYV